MTETRRAALKMLGTIGATCAFPFAGDELHGQHVHTVLLQTSSSAPYKPSFFTPAEYETLSRLTDVIIPATDTPGATGAGVPEYIDRVVSLNAEHQSLVRAGLAWLEQEAKARFSRSFLTLGESQHVTILQPISEEVDREERELQSRRFKTEAARKRVYYVPITDKAPPPRPADALDTRSGDPRLPAKFFRLIKSLTADGYYTSRVGLLEELGYAGNTALSRFPGCSVPEQ
jgi:gluconate 2-dehydrogenase gamma chain